MLPPRLLALSQARLCRGAGLVALALAHAPVTEAATVIFGEGTDYEINRTTVGRGGLRH